MSALHKLHRGDSLTAAGVVMLRQPLFELGRIRARLGMTEQTDLFGGPKS